MIQTLKSTDLASKSGQYQWDPLVGKGSLKATHLKCHGWWQCLVSHATGVTHLLGSSDYLGWPLRFESLQWRGCNPGAEGVLQWDIGGFTMAMVQHLWSLLTSIDWFFFARDVLGSL